MENKNIQLEDHEYNGHKYRPRNRALIPISYEHLASALGIKMGSIRAITVDVEKEFIKIVHDDDESGVWATAEGQQIPYQYKSMASGVLIREWIELIKAKKFDELYEMVSPVNIDRKCRDDDTLVITRK